MFGPEFWMILGFLLAAYSIVAKIAGIDLSKAGAGLTASVILALTLPRIFPGETGGPRVAVAEPAAESRPKDKAPKDL